jgi:hypothetical protein
MAKKDSVRRDAEGALTEQLRALFDTIAEQPVPGRIMARRRSEAASDDL